MKFNIVIPTRNRGAELKRQLISLDRQVRSISDFLEFNRIDLKIIVNDNNSDESVSDVTSLNGYFSRCYDVGGNHNWILSVAEFECDFVWTLGDNMPLADGALQTILDHTLNNRSSDVIVFYPTDNLLSNKTMVSNNCLEILNMIPDFGPLIHISSIVVRHAAFLEGISDIILYQSTFFPQFIYQIQCLHKKTHCLIYENIFVTDGSGRRAPRDVYAVSSLVCYSFDIMELFLDSKETKAYRRLIRNTRKTWLTPKGVLYEICKLGQKNSFLYGQGFKMMSKGTSVAYTGLCKGLFWRFVGLLILRYSLFRNMYIRLYEYNRGFSVVFRNSLKSWDA
jgi:hypothetical protein